MELNMNNVIVGVDKSATARKAADRAASLAAGLNANLHIVTCVARKASEQVSSEGDSWFVSPKAEAETFLNDLAGELAGESAGELAHDRISIKVSFEDPATAICQEAAELDAVMIVVGNRRVQGVSRILGSIASDVLKQAPCDVLIANTTG
jgi:nucleotide-binding universal stress UspA family protein